MTEEAKAAEKMVVLLEDYDDDEAWDDAYRKAAHMLHEQAHGTGIAWRFCPEQPCRDLPDRSTGPASASSVGLF